MPPVSLQHLYERTKVNNGQEATGPTEHPRDDGCIEPSVERVPGSVVNLERHTKARMEAIKKIMDLHLREIRREVGKKSTKLNTPRGMSTLCTRSII